MELLAEQVSYLQHHDGTTGTSKYMVMDLLEKQNQALYDSVQKGVISEAFSVLFPLGTDAPIF
jgi:hypothetical protein